MDKTYWIEIKELDTNQTFVGNWTGRSKKECQNKAIEYYANKFFLPIDLFKVIYTK